MVRWLGKILVINVINLDVVILGVVTRGLLGNVAIMAKIWRGKMCHNTGIRVIRDPHPWCWVMWVMSRFVFIATSQGISARIVSKWETTLQVVRALVIAAEAAVVAGMAAAAGMVGVRWTLFLKPWTSRRLYTWAWRWWQTRRSSRQRLELQKMLVLLTNVGNKVSIVSQKTDYWQFSIMQWLIFMSESVVFDWFKRSCVIKYVYFYVG